MERKPQPKSLPRIKKIAAYSELGADKERREAIRRAAERAAQSGIL
jgi:hypothetical protein